MRAASTTPAAASAQANPTTMDVPLLTPRSSRRRERPTAPSAAFASQYGAHPREVKRHRMIRDRRNARKTQAAQGLRPRGRAKHEPSLPPTEEPLMRAAVFEGV